MTVIFSSNGGAKRFLQINNQQSTINNQQSKSEAHELSSIFITTRRTATKDQVFQYKIKIRI